MQESYSLGNQQVTERQLGWLSGIIDGEGCFTLSEGSKGGFNPGIKIVNTDMSIVNEVIKILRLLELPLHVYDAWRAKNQRPAKRVEITGMRRVNRALRILCPYVIGKKEQAEFLYEFTCSRLSTESVRGWYTEREVFLYYLLAEYKKPESGTSETTRETRSLSRFIKIIGRDDIVRPTVESGRE